MRSVSRVAILAVAYAMGTAAFGWWAIPITAAVWGLIAGPGAAGASAIAAAVAWAALLLTPAVGRAPVLAFATNLAGAMSIPAWALLSAEFVLPLMLAWSATAFFASIRERPHGKI